MERGVSHIGQQKPLSTHCTLAGQCGVCGGVGVGRWGGRRERERKEREREFWSHGECRMVWVFELGWRECGLGWSPTQDRQMDSGTTQHRALLGEAETPTHAWA